MLKDATDAVAEIGQFYDTIESVHNFFAYNIERRQKFQHVHDRPCSSSTLKAFNPTPCSDRYDAVHALKERFCDVMTCLTNITLISTKPKGKR